MDWIAVVVAAVLASIFAGIIAVTRVGINMHRHPRTASRLCRAKGEYQPPDPPEGRYWDERLAHGGAG